MDLKNFLVKFVSVSGDNGIETQGIVLRKELEKEFDEIAEQIPIKLIKGRAQKKDGSFGVLYVDFI